MPNTFLDEENPELPEADPNEIPESEKEPDETDDEVPKEEMEFTEEDSDDEDDDESPTRRRRRKSPEDKKNSLNERAKEQLSQELDDIVEELAPGRTKNVFLTVTRVEPKVWKGKRLEGFIEKRDAAITEDELKETHGGGTYDIKFFGPKKYSQGLPVGNKILRSKRIKIAGDPIIQEEKKTSSDDPGIVSMALKAQQDLLSRKEAEQDKISKQNEKLMEMALNGGGNKTDVGMIQLIQNVMDSVKNTANMQLVAAQEQIKIMREEMNKREDRYREELRRIEEKSEKTAMPMLDYLNKQQTESNKKSEMVVQQMTEMFKIQLMSAQEASKNQIEMIQASHRMQSEMLMNELKRQSEELKDARISSNKGDILSELKKVASIKNIMSEISGGDANLDNSGIAEKLIDKIPEMAESLPGILSAIGGLFGGQKQQVVRRVIPAQPRAMLPPSPQARPQAQQPQPQPQPEPKPEQETQEQAQDNQKIALMIATIVQNLENSIDKNIKPEDFINEHIVGKFDDDILRKVTSVPAGVLLKFIEENLDAGDDNIVNTTAGRDYIRNCLVELKKKLP